VALGNGQDSAHEKLIRNVSSRVFSNLHRVNSFSLLHPSIPPSYLVSGMLGHQFAFSAAPIRKVKEVQFGILSPEEIVRIL
jgi:hypothetical protein